MLTNFKLLGSDLVTGPLLAAIDRQPELWGEITARQDTPGSPHRYTEAIILRWSRDRSIQAAFNDIETVDYPALDRLPEARPLIAAVTERTQGLKVGRVMIAKLESGGFIDPHVDEGAYADHYERFHISLVSDEGNSFYTWSRDDCGEFVHMREREMWWFNHKARHSLLNDSGRDRLHLIVDCVAPDYRRERI